MNTQRHYPNIEHAPFLHRTINTHAASWRTFLRSYSKACHLQMRDDAMDNAREADRLHTMHQRNAVEQYGPIRRLVSGGICEYWPRAVKDTIGNLARLVPLWEDLALAHHKAAGLRRSTFGPDMIPAQRPPVQRAGTYDGINTTIATSCA